MLNRRALLQGLVGAGAVGGVAAAFGDEKPSWIIEETTGVPESAFQKKEETTAFALFAEVGMGGLVYTKRLHMEEFRVVDLKDNIDAGRVCMSSSSSSPIEHIATMKRYDGSPLTVIMLATVESLLSRTVKYMSARQMAMFVLSQGMHGDFGVQTAEEWKRYKWFGDLFPREQPRLNLSFWDREHEWSEHGIKRNVTLEGFDEPMQIACSPSRLSLTEACENARLYSISRGDVG